MTLTFLDTIGKTDAELREMSASAAAARADRRRRYVLRRTKLRLHHTSRQLRELKRRNKAKLSGLSESNHRRQQDAQAHNDNLKRVCQMYLRKCSELDKRPTASGFRDHARRYHFRIGEKKAEEVMRAIRKK